MGFINWLKKRKKQLIVFSQTQPNIAHASVEEVFLEGIFEDPLKAVFLERAYMASHPCSCGGEWKRIGGGIGGDGKYSVAFSECVCNTCGAEKKFVFKFHGWNDQLEDGINTYSRH